MTRLLKIHILSLMACVCMLAFAVPSGAKKSKSASESVAILLDESDALMMNREFEKAMEKSIAALDLANNSGLKKEEVQALCSIAKIDLATSRDERAWQYAVQAEQSAREAGFSELLVRALVIKAQVCLYAEISPDFNRNDEGLAYVDEIMSMTEDGTAAAERAQAYIVASQFYVNKNRWNDRNLDKEIYRKAGEMLSQGESLIDELGLTDMKRKALSSRMRYYRQGANYQGAIEFCLTGIENSDPNDYLTLYQLKDHLTTLYLETGEEQLAVQSHADCVYYMQKYISQKADTALQEQETKYETALKQQTIRRRGYQLVSAVLALILLIIVAVLLVIRNRRIALQKEELNRQNESKEQLLAFISKDFANPTNAQADAIHKFAQECSKLNPEEVKERCEEFICGVQSLSNDVAQYVFNIIVSQQAAAKKLELSDREVEIVQLSAQGLSAAQIAEKLFLSTRTVSNHKQNIYSKMDVKSNSEMIRKAREAGILKD